MSAYTQGPSSYNEREWDTDAPPSAHLAPIEQALNSARQMEAALRTERQRMRRMQEDFRRTYAMIDEKLRDSESRSNESVADKKRAELALEMQRQHEQKLMRKGRALHLELQNCRKELHKYQSSWNTVMLREQDARSVITASQNNARRKAELEQHLERATRSLEHETKQREQAVRHSESYQKELQSALVRLHSAETKFSEISREYQAMHQSRRRVDDEVAKIERSLRERMKWEYAKECEGMKAELQRNAAVERESFREQTRKQLRDEIEGIAVAERQRLEREVESARLEAAEYKEARYQDKVEQEHRYQAAIQAVQEANQIENDRLQAEIQASQKAVTSANIALQTRIEELKARADEIALLAAERILIVTEGDRLRADSAQLRREMEQLRGDQERILREREAETMKVRQELEESRLRFAKREKHTAEVERRLSKVDASFKLATSRGEAAESELNRLKAQLAAAQDAEIRAAAFERALNHCVNQIEVLEAKAFIARGFTRESTLLAESAEIQ